MNEIKHTIIISLKFIKRQCCQLCYSDVEHGLQYRKIKTISELLENAVLRKIFEISVERKFYNSGLHELYSGNYIIHVIKSKRYGGLDI